MAKQVSMWKKNHMRRYPCLSRFYHIPNEGNRKPWIAAQMGIVSGVSDYHFAARTEDYIGLYLEIKDKGKKPTLNQRAWLEESVEYGFMAKWSDNLQEIFSIIENYAIAVEAYKKGK